MAAPLELEDFEFRRRRELELAAQQKADKPEPEKPTKPSIYELGVNALQDMPWYEKAAANVGAGMSDFGLGARQLVSDFAGWTGKSKALREEAAEKRELDRALAEKSFEMPLGQFLGKGLQVAGSAAPTALVPAAGSMQAKRALPWALQSAGTGAAIGALTPLTEYESRSSNAALGAGSNLFLPLAMRGGNAIWNNTTRGGGANRAGQEVAKEVTEGIADPAAQRVALQQTIERLRNIGGNADDIPLSTAARLRDPHLARLEAGSRARNGASWYDFDQTQHRAIYDKFMNATRESDELASRAGNRRANWNQNWSDAQNFRGPTTWAKDLPGFRANLDVAMLSPEASNPAVRGMLNEIAGEIDRVGAGFTPAHLQQIRANLSAKYNPIASDSYAKVPRDSTARLSVMREVDDIMNKATGGEWDKVTSGYRADSIGVHQAKAAEIVRAQYIDKATGRVQKTAAENDIPVITEAGLGRSLNAARQSDKSLALSPDANARLAEILRALRSQNIVQRVKRSATAGGGSNTTSDKFAASAAQSVANDIPGIKADITRAVVQGVKSRAQGLKDEALAAALQSPDEMIRLIERQLQLRQPLTPQMEAFLSVVRNSPAAMATN